MVFLHPRPTSLLTALLLLLPQFFQIANAAPGDKCGTQSGGNTPPSICSDPLECCSKFGFCDIGDAWCGEGCQSGRCYASLLAVTTTTTTPMPTRVPTPLPTAIMAVETIPIKFDVRGLGDDNDNEGSTITELTIEMTTIMNRIFFALEGVINGLKVLAIDENYDYANRYPITTNVIGEGGNNNDERGSGGRTMTLYYNVNVQKDRRGNREFKPLIIEQLRASYVDILDSISFADVNYIARDMKFNWCANTEMGGYPLCVHEWVTEPPSLPAPPTAPSMPQQQTPNRPPTSSSSSLQSNDPNSNNGDEDNEGLAGWAIALIVVLLLSILGCMIYYVLLTRQRNKEENYQDDDDRSYRYDDNYDSNQEEDERPQQQQQQRSSFLYAQNNNTAPDSIEHVSYASRGVQRDINSMQRQTMSGSIASASRGSRQTQQQRQRQQTMETLDANNAISSGGGKKSKRKQSKKPSESIAGAGRGAKRAQTAETKRAQKEPLSGSIANARSYGSSRRKVGRDPSVFQQPDNDKRQSRDPTLYMPGRDPAAAAMSGAGDATVPGGGGGRDPSVFIPGGGGRDPSVFIPGGGRRDPSVCVPGGGGKLDPDTTGSVRGKPKKGEEASVRGSGGGRNAGRNDDQASVRSDRVSGKDVNGSSNAENIDLEANLDP